MGSVFLISKARPYRQACAKFLSPSWRSLPRAPLCAGALLLLAAPAHAVQSHGGAEGLVSHQIGHLLFTAGMFYLLYRISTKHIQGRGWGEFKMFLWLLIAWNITTFTGHWMNEHISQDKFIREGGQNLAFITENLQDIVYYASRLDHLLLVPSFAFLAIALRKWRQSS